MAKKQYTQTVEPVSRIAERIFGWLAWIALLAVTGFILFFSLVMVNDPAFIESIRQEVQNVIAQQGSGELSPDQMTDVVLGTLNSSWMLALYLAVPLILGLFGLLTMRRRILAGFLLLIAGILTAPLVFAIVTGLIPLFFVIAAILLFVRKNRVIKHDDEFTAGDERRRDDRLDNQREPEAERRGRDAGSTTAGAGAAGAAYGGREDDSRRDDDMKMYERQPAERDRNNKGDDLESTRQYNAIDDETERDYRMRKTKAADEGGAAYGDERSVRGEDRYVDNENISEGSDRYVDRNIDSRETTEPVTEEEFTRKGGTPGFDEEASRDDGRTLNNSEGNRRNHTRGDDEYGYDASRERRNNLDRRNNGE